MGPRPPTASTEQSKAAESTYSQRMDADAAKLARSESPGVRKINSLYDLKATMRDTILFYHPQFEKLAAAVAEASDQVVLGEMRWATFNDGFPSSDATRTFEGLMSRWMIPF